MSRLLLVAFVLVAVLCSLSAVASAQTGGTAPAPNEQTKESGKEKKDDDFGDKCRPGVPGLNEVLDAACDVGKTTEEQVTGAPAKIADTIPVVPYAT